jgi:hypothetical protein
VALVVTLAALLPLTNFRAPEDPMEAASMGGLFHLREAFARDDVGAANLAQRYRRMVTAIERRPSVRWTDQS